LQGPARQQMVDEFASATSLGAGFKQLRDAMRANQFRARGHQMFLDRAIRSYDGRTRAEGFHILHDWDGVAQRTNPEIIPIGSDQVEGWEGCLSIPDIRGMVPRYTDITLKALDRTGKPFEMTLKKFAARVAQHESDHLDGVLFFDRMASMQTLTYLEEFSRFHAKDDD